MKNVYLKPLIYCPRGKNGAAQARQGQGRTEKNTECEPRGGLGKGAASGTICDETIGRDCACARRLGYGGGEDAAVRPVRFCCTKLWLAGRKLLMTKLPTERCPEWFFFQLYTPHAPSLHKPDINYIKLFLFYIFSFSPRNSFSFKIQKFSNFKICEVIAILNPLERWYSRDF